MKKDFSPYLLPALMIILVYLSFLLLKRFVSAIIWAAVLGYLFRPLYLKLNSKIKHPTTSALIISTLVILIILMPLVPIVAIIGNQIIDIYVFIAQEGIIDKIPEYISTDVNINNYITEGLNKGIPWVVGKISSFILSIPSKLIDVFMFLFLLFYILKEGDVLVKWVRSLLPMPDNYKDKLIREVTNGTRSILYGVVIAALFQGLIGTIGLVIFGMPKALFWGMIMTFFALIPFIGAWIIWLPASVWMVATGRVIGGIGLFIYGSIIVSSVDNIIRSKIIGNKTKIHPAIILLGLVGGLFVFGLVGVIIGPIVLLLLGVTLKIYKEMQN